MNVDRSSTRHSVFWRVAAVLVAVQLATGLLAIGLSAYLASDRSVNLAENGLRVRMDALAEEIERSSITDEGTLAALPSPVLSNLSFRFPDPLSLLDTEGHVLQTIFPAPDSLGEAVVDTTRRPTIPDDYVDIIISETIRIESSSETVPGGWAIAPLYDASGLLAGGLVIQPIDQSLARELAPTRKAFRTALISVAVGSVLLAILLASVLTWWLVRPLRRITSSVIKIGAGDFTTRIETSGSDEIAQLGATVNRMADQVSASIEALRTTDRLRRELVANVGHDLRTPLAALRGHIEEGLRFFGENRLADGNRSFESAQVQTEYLQRLVDDLFELSVLENPFPAVRSEPVPLAELLHEASRNHAPMMLEHGIEFQVEIPRELPVIEADGVRLMRVMDNLLTNARRHTTSGEQIWLRARLSDTEVQIEIGDSGDGMDSETLERIFDRYYRGSSSRTRAESGTGLGLAISRAVAELHGGRLDATSEPGVGSRFVLTLPRRNGPKLQGPGQPVTGSP